MQDFNETIEQFKSGELKVKEWNFCIQYSKLPEAYIMGCGAEQCLAHKSGFNDKQEIIDLYRSLGVERILPI